jgi:cytochrome c-type biogenesis protein CcmE
MTRRQRRLTLIGIAAVVLSLAAGLALSALRDSIVFFVTPSELAAKPVAAGSRFRLGGLVEEGSVVRDGLDVRFRVTDGGANLPVRYHGLLPDLFREKQGVVAEGKLDPSGTFVADTVLAKHDERYMPREVADALKKQGHWQGEHGVSHPGEAKK